MGWGFASNWLVAVNNLASPLQKLILWLRPSSRLFLLSWISPHPSTCTEMQLSTSHVWDFTNCLAVGDIRPTMRNECSCRPATNKMTWGPSFKFILGSILVLLEFTWCVSESSVMVGCSLWICTDGKYILGGVGWICGEGWALLSITPVDKSASSYLPTAHVVHDIYTNPIYLPRPFFTSPLFLLHPLSSQHLIKSPRRILAALGLRDTQEVKMPRLHLISSPIQKNEGFTLTRGSEASSTTEQKPHMHTEKTGYSRGQIDNAEPVPQFVKHEESTNIELFYDLFFVANLTTFSNVHEVNSRKTLTSYIGFFCVLWFTWCQTSLFDIRFVADSWLERVAKACHLGVMVGLAVVGPNYDTEVGKEAEGEGSVTPLQTMVYSFPSPLCWIASTDFWTGLDFSCL